VKSCAWAVVGCLALATSCGSQETGEQGTSSGGDTGDAAPDGGSGIADALFDGQSEGAAIEESASLDDVGDIAPRDEPDSPDVPVVEAGAEGGADAAPMTCDPDAMPLPNEGLAEAAGGGGCPSGMVAIETFCIDRYEASLVLIDADAASSSWSPYVNPAARGVRAVSIAGAVPQAYIGQLQADAACGAAGKRLCTDAEWLRACRGSSTWTYPYGELRQPGTCNDTRALNPVVQYFGSTDPSVFAHSDNACIDQQADTVRPAGSLAACVTPEGVYDMMGNLNEWTADPAGTFRGGFFVDTTLNGNGCLYATTAHDVLHWDYSTGFRCCADP
jgi:sulfatase modifying factor 1